MNKFIALMLLVSGLVISGNMSAWRGNCGANSCVRPCKTACATVEEGPKPECFKLVEQPVCAERYVSYACPAGTQTR